MDGCSGGHVNGDGDSFYGCGGDGDGDGDGGQLLRRRRTGAVKVENRVLKTHGRITNRLNLVDKAQINSEILLKGM